MKSVTINLYQFDELSAQAQRKAIEDHRNFELARMQKEDFISGDPEYDTEEELEKQYQAEYNYYLLEDDPIIESIQANEYYFFGDGELAQTVTYCGAHPKSGITEFKFKNQIYQI